MSIVGVSMSWETGLQILQTPPPRPPPVPFLPPCLPTPLPSRFPSPPHPPCFHLPACFPLPMLSERAIVSFPSFSWIFFPLFVLFRFGGYFFPRLCELIQLQCDKDNSGSYWCIIETMLHVFRSRFFVGRWLMGTVNLRLGNKAGML